MARGRRARRTSVTLRTRHLVVEVITLDWVSVFTITAVLSELSLGRRPRKRPTSAGQQVGAAPAAGDKSWRLFALLPKRRT